MQWGSFTGAYMHSANDHHSYLIHRPQCQKSVAILDLKISPMEKYIGNTKMLIDPLPLLPEVSHSFQQTQVKASLHMGPGSPLDPSARSQMSLSPLCPPLPHSSPWGLLAARPQARSHLWDFAPAVSSAWKALLPAVGLASVPQLPVTFPGAA